MAVDRVNSSRQVPGPAVPTTGELIERLSRFEGQPEQFLINLLAVQCHIASASAGAILRLGSEGNTEAIAVYPPVKSGSTPPVWLAQAAEMTAQVISEGKTTSQPLRNPDELYGQPAQRNLVIVPIGGNVGVRGVSAFLVEGSDGAALAACCERLELSSSLLSLYEMRMNLQKRGADLQRLRLALETLSAVNENDRFTGAAMALCNEVASRWGCERVGVGFLKGRYVELKAMSHTEKFSRKMKLVQDIEATMEECLDQDVEIIFPNDPEATFVSRAANELSKKHGPSTVLSLPLRRGAEVVGVLTVERPNENLFHIEEIEALRLTCDLSTPRVDDLHKSDLWVGAKAAAAMREGLAKFIGPKHTWLKVAAIFIFAVLMFLIFVKGDYKAEASFVIEATQRQIISAPFDGYLKDVHVRPASQVKAGSTVLATLEDAELELQLAEAEAQRLAYLKEEASAMRDGKTSEAQIARANADQVKAKIKLLEYKIDRASMVSPIDGIVLKGDLERQKGALVEAGDGLFEVAPLESLNAELLVPEDQISDVVKAFEEAKKEGNSVGGQLATVSEPDKKINFIVENINPVAEVLDQKNVFRVRVELLERPRGILPGLEGVGKIKVGRRSYLFLFTRRLVNWVRMKLWL